MSEYVTRADPPPQLLYRSTGSLDAEEFWRVGAVIKDTLMTAAGTYLERTVTDVLDWGCGPGRVARHFTGWTAIRPVCC